MNNTIKVSLTINLEGSTYTSVGKKTKIPYIITAEDKYGRKNCLKNKINPSKIIDKGFRKHPIKVRKDVKQHINIGLDTYKWMITECPYGIQQKRWQSMSKKQRLEWHMYELCQNFKGYSYSYEVLEE
jgi:hypothetical protein